MKRILSVTGILAGALWLCTASAGVHSSFPLTISGTTASGALGTVRNDATQNGIWCTLRGCSSSDACTRSQSPAPIFMECAATSPAVSIHCSSTNANVIAALQAMSPDSYVSFTSSQTGANGTCTSLTVSNGSIYEPPSTYP